jgi:hypothetical protein
VANALRFDSTVGSAAVVESAKLEQTGDFVGAFQRVKAGS